MEQSHTTVSEGYGESEINIDVEVKIRNEDPPIFGYADGIWSGLATTTLC